MGGATKVNYVTVPAPYGTPIEFAGTDKVYVASNGSPSAEPNLSGRMPYMVPMPCIVGSASKPGGGATSKPAASKKSKKAESQPA